MESEMEPPCGRSYMQVLCEKYSPENFPYRRGPGAGVHVPPGPQVSPMKDRLNLPSILVLNSCGISHAGDESEIAAFCSHVSELDLSGNKLGDWQEVSKIVSNVPQLQFLNLSSNPLHASVLERECAATFSGIRKLVLNNCKVSWETVHTLLLELPDRVPLYTPHEYPALSLGISSWDDIEKLNTLPTLEEVRLLGIPLVEPYSTEERRKLTIARLPSVSKLNGSVVTEGEREDSERFFVRYYMNVPKEEVPLRYQELVRKYGKLEPLAEVDLRPQNQASVDLHYEEKVQKISVRLDQTVAEFKKQLKAVVQLPTSNMRLYYLDHETPFGLEEMKFSTRALHSYNVRDGVKFFVEPKMK
ncbi:hypothetical protein GDO78_011301 [Eleutherodactylus coqui]|uniref:Ubiquitin-like domain-containing protein n=1 Tax=Eleutherodactylus coqui TaxID=57060 RepID=A0A8J6K6E3_ELECQ|nr:hypothetical protein GDO78_011301 [Eleutherodactylus coqui]KAG9482553.1 hypothetical protein GDO78_011301 [Eleutherodactylus coqui]